jgi:D-lactate dehydrogenase
MAMHGTSTVEPLLRHAATGHVTAQFVMQGFGCRVVAFDVKPNKELADNGTVEYLGMDEVLQSADILTLHCPLMSKTFHIIDKDG